MFISQNRHLGMEGVCEFLKPFLNLLVIQMSSSATMSSLARNLLSSIASLCCSFPQDAIPVFKLLMGCCKYVQCNNTEVSEHGSSIEKFLFFQPIYTNIVAHTYFSNNNIFSRMSPMFLISWRLLWMLLLVF